ncbi:hypothetical protein GGI04_005448, partial [Coemansia thaxteri]
MAIGKLVHIGVDLVLLSTALAGIRRSTGLKVKTDSLVDSKDMQGYIQQYLNVGEKTLDLAAWQMGYNAGSAGDQFVDFSFCESKDISEFVSIRIDNLWGNSRRLSASANTHALDDQLRLYGLSLETGPADVDDDYYGKGDCSQPQSILFVTAQLFSFGIPLSLPLQTKYSPKTAHDRRWDEWIRFPT